MNGTVRKGLALICLAVVFAIFWLALRPADPPLIRGSGVDRQTFSDAFRGFAGIAGVTGLVVVAKGLLRD